MSEAAEQGDEADEAFGGMVAGADMPPHARAVLFGRGHRFAAYPRCSASAEDASVTRQTRVESYFVEEPRWEAYQGLVDALAECSTTVLLVAREQLKLSDEAKEVFRRLLPFRQRRVRTSRWPGTQLIGQFAHVNYYPASLEVAAILKTAVERLYAWKQPDRPEDLAFLNRDGLPTLTTIAHEKDAWVTLPPDALERVKRVVGSRFFGEPR